MGNGQFGHGRWSRPLVKAVWSPSECSISVALPANAARAGCQPLRWLRTRKVASHLLLQVLKLFSKITLVPTSCCMVAKITRIPIGGNKSRFFPSIVACSPKLRLFPPSVDYAYSHLLLYVRPNHNYFHLLPHVRQNQHAEDGWLCLR